MEGNSQNQAFVRQLGTVGVAPNPELRDMGMTAMVDEDGKVTITRVGPLAQLGEEIKAAESETQDGGDENVKVEE